MTILYNVAFVLVTIVAALCLVAISKRYSSAGSVIDAFISKDPKQRRAALIARALFFLVFFVWLTALVARLSV